MSEIRLFGKRKFGSFKFGATVLSSPRYGLAVDWDSDGLFDGVSEGEYLTGLTIERGRRFTFSSDGESFQVEDTGRLSARLLDSDRRFDMFNMSSPLYGMLAGGKKFRLRVRTPSDSVYDLMAGVLDEPVSYRERGEIHAKLDGVDGWGFLRDQSNYVTVPLQENIYADDAMALLLEKADWPRPWGYDLDNGVDERGYFWVDARSAAQVIHELAQNELGQVVMDAAGNLRFRSRVSLESDVLTLGDTDVTNVERFAPKDAIRNVIVVAAAPRAEKSVQTVWELPGALEIDAGETVSDVWADFQYAGERVPVKDPITPVSVTDFEAWTNEDKTGTDLTANFSVSMNPFSTRGQLTVTNGGGTAGFFFCKVRGNPIVKESTVRFEYRDEASIKQFGPRPFTLTVDQNVNVARQYRELLALYLTSARNYLMVDLMPGEYDTQFGVDLGQVIQCNFTNYGVSGSFRVMGIKHEWADDAGIVVRTRWWLEPFFRLFAGVQVPFQLPAQLGGS